MNDDNLMIIFEMIKSDVIIFILKSIIQDTYSCCKKVCKIQLQVKLGSIKDTVGGARGQASTRKGHQSNYLMR